MSIRSIVIACSGSLGFLLLVLGFANAAGFDAKSIKGGYGCVGSLSAVISGTSGGFSNLMQLTFDGKGGVTGQMNIFAVGEVCPAVISGKYSVSANGMGTLTLTSSTSGQDSDSDSGCSQFNGVSEHVSLVIESKGKTFDFMVADDFLTPFGGDTGDTKDTFTGSCKSQ